MRISKGGPQACPAGRRRCSCVTAKHPSWYYNLMANPTCALGEEKFVASQVTDADEYRRLFDLAERYYGGFSDYRANTARIGRTIPVLRLTPIPS